MQLKLNFFKEHLPVWITIFIFITLNAVLILNEQYWGFILPAILLIFYWTVFKFENVWYLTVVLTPFSIPLSELMDLNGLNLLVPTEPLIIGILFVFLFRALQGVTINKNFILHPLTIAVGIYFVWIVFTSISSSIPFVSIKFALNRLWYIIAFYILSSSVFSTNRKITKYFWAYLISFGILIIFSTAKLSTYGFTNQKAAHWVMNPFYNDHTAYGALIAFYLPVAFSLFFIEKRKDLKVLSVALVCLLFTGLVLSYSRAAWVSMLASVAFGVILLLRIKFKQLLLAGAAGLLLLVVFGSALKMQLEQNKQDSSGDIGEHIQSISNIRSDASNLERINRWNCAIELFKEKPILGWGPGTYQFVYAPFQASSDLTIISTDFGNRGTAHSEYLGPLAESGLPGFISVVALLFMSIGIGMSAYYRLKNTTDKWILGATLSGLVSYWIHGFLNNFLDTDKASVPFWGFMAIIVIYSIRNQKNSTPNMVTSSKT